MELDVATWTLEFHSGIPIYRQIIHRVQAAVAERRLAPGDQLPTIRAVHETLNVNPNTVAKAYRELEHMGVITAEQGSGCFIAPAAPAKPAALPAREKKAKLRDICARFVAEARSHGISCDELVAQLHHHYPT